MKRSGAADLALMGGSIPPWLFDRMVKLSGVVVESIVAEYGQQAFLRRLSDPVLVSKFWGCNWHGLELVGRDDGSDGGVEKIAQSDVQKPGFVRLRWQRKRLPFNAQSTH